MTTKDNRLAAGAQPSGGKKTDALCIFDLKYTINDPTAQRQPADLSPRSNGIYHADALAGRLQRYGHADQTPARIERARLRNGGGKQA